MPTSPSLAKICNTKAPYKFKNKCIIPYKTKRWVYRVEELFTTGISSSILT